jgi:hypothetical protein
MLIQLQADVSQLKVGLSQAENALKGIDKSVQTTASGMTNFITKMKQVGASIGIAFAGTQVLAFGRDVIAQAQEAEAQRKAEAAQAAADAGDTYVTVKVGEEDLAATITKSQTNQSLSGSFINVNRFGRFGPTP